MENNTFESIACWLAVLNAYEEKPNQLYNIEYAAADLEGLREYIDDPDIDLNAISPEMYRDAMNYNILHVWHSLKEGGNGNENSHEIFCPEIMQRFF